MSKLFILVLLKTLFIFSKVSHAAVGPSLVTSVTGNSIQSSFSPTGSTWSTPAVAQERGSYANGADQMTYNGGGMQMQNSGASAGGNAYGMVGGSGVSNGYGNGQSQGQGQGSETAQSAMTYHYYHYPGNGGNGNGNGGGGGWGPPKGAGDDDDDDFNPLQLVGLLGLKGLKGLKGAFAVFKLLKLLLLPLLLLFLPLLLLPLLFLLLFIPIPVITPGGGRILTSPLSIGEMVSEKIFNSVQVTQQVLNGPNCIDRIACEVSRKSKDTFFDKIVRGLFDVMGSYLPEKWRRTMQTYMDTGKVSSSEKCSSSYPCNEVSPYFTEAKTKLTEPKKKSPSSSSKFKRNGSTKAT